MQAPRPHYLLFAAATRRPCQPRRWRFVLEPIGGGQRRVAADAEANTERNRLELLAVVRGLEALEQPSHVTLLTRSRYVRRGIRDELCHWRDAHWRWESFGKLVPIRDHDLWQRVERALTYHQVQCPRWQWDEEAREPALTDSGIDMRAPIAASVTCRAGDQQSATRPRVVVPRRSPRRRHTLRPDDFPAPRRRANWPQRVLSAMTGLGQPALSRTA